MKKIRNISFTGQDVWLPVTSNPHHVQGACREALKASFAAATATKVPSSPPALRNRRLELVDMLPCVKKPQKACGVPCTKKFFRRVSEDHKTLTKLLRTAVRRNQKAFERNT